MSAQTNLIYFMLNKVEQKYLFLAIKLMPLLFCTHNFHSCQMSFDTLSALMVVSRLIMPILWKEKAISGGPFRGKVQIKKYSLSFWGLCCSSRFWLKHLAAVQPQASDVVMGFKEKKKYYFTSILSHKRQRRK